MGIITRSTEDIAREGMVMALRDLEYHNKNDCIIVDLCFNTYVDERQLFEKTTNRIS